MNIFYSLNWTAISTIISLIISFLVFIVILCTLFEMKKQRSFTYRPYILIDNCYISIKNDNKARPFIWVSNDKEYPMFFYLELWNIGFGTARTINIEWLINHKEIDKRFQELINRSNGLLKRENTESGIHYNYSNYGFFIEKVEKEHVPFINSGSKVKIKLAETIKAYLSFYPILKWMAKKDWRYLFKEQVPLKIKITYKDISNKIIEKTLKLFVDFYIEGKKVKINNQNVITGKIILKEK